MSLNYNPRAKTANTFRLNSEFSFKDKFESHNNSGSKKFNQATGFHAKIKVNKSVKGIQKIVEKYSSLKTSNQNLNSLSQSELEHELKKDEEINNLNEYIQECVSANDEIKYLISVELAARGELESEQRSIADYCNDLKRKFANIEQTIEDYEQTVSRLKNENLQLQENYNKKIDEMEKDNKRHLERLEDRMNIVKMQRNKIREYELKAEIELKDIEEQKNYYLERQMLNKIKFDELEKKFAGLQKKIYEYEMNDDVRRAEMAQSSRRVNISKSNLSRSIELDEVDMKIQEYEQKNQELMNTLKDMTHTFTELQAKDFSEDYNKSSKISAKHSEKNSARNFHK